MEVRENLFVAIDYTLTLDSGEVVDSSSPNEPLGFVLGSGQIIPGLEKGLIGMNKGQSGKIIVSAEEGYGQYREDLHIEIPRTQFPEDMDIQPGMGFEANGPQGLMTFQVKSVGADAITADFNHPLAGEQLHFDITVAEVREPSAEELTTAAAAGGCGCGATSTCGCEGHDCK